jgi:hypothetical protein
LSSTYSYPRLNLPPIQLKTELRQGTKTYFWEPIRKKWLWLSPEEWVRQHMVHFLITYKNYPKNLIALELPQSYGSLAKRCDIVVYNTMQEVCLLVECKASHIAINQSTLSQLLSYQHGLTAAVLCMTNGKSHYVLKVQNTDLVPLSDIPDFEKL